jgi:protein-S-isoprenylcysteine O-methyltransferase Ste14
MVGGVELAGFHCALGVTCDQRSFSYDLVFGFVFIALGIVVASPAWWALHKRNHRTWFAAAALGVASVIAALLLAVAVFICIPAIVYGWRPDSIEPDYFVRLALYLLVGGSVGWAVWRTAYQTVADEAPTPSA